MSLVPAPGEQFRGAAQSFPQPFFFPSYASWRLGSRVLGDLRCMLLNLICPLTGDKWFARLKKY